MSTKLPNVIILAAGQGLRWQSTAKRQHKNGENDTLSVVVENKLMLDIAGSPLLWRTLQGLKHHNIPAPIIYGNKLQLPAQTQTFYPAQAPETIIGTIQASQPCWDQANDCLFLLGDVVWTTTAIKHCLAPITTDWRFYGKLSGNAFTGKRWPEIYGLRARRNSLDHVVAAADHLQTRKVWRAKLWELYRVLLGHTCPATKPDPGYLFHPPSSDQFQVIPDCTDDIDTLKEYVIWQQLLKANPRWELL